MIQRITKLTAKIILEIANFLNVCLNNKNNTHEIIANGIMVIKPSIIININPALPSKTRLV